MSDGLPSAEEIDRLLAAAAECAGLGPLTLVEPIGGGLRSIVGRVTDGGRTYVVKVMTKPELGTWSRESSALRVLVGSGLTPDLLGADADAELVVVDDLGPPDALSDRLVGDDPAAAEDATIAWARMLAALHADGEAHAHAFTDVLSEVHPLAPPTLIDGRLAETAGWVRSRAEALGLDGDVVEAGAAVLTTVADRFAVARTVLSPGDTCPDNQFLTAGRFVDFEWAEVRHPAWDLAYLTVPFPTCWCSWRLPDGVAHRALDAYLDATGVRRAERPAWRHDVDLATQAWALESAAMQWDSAVEHGPWEHPLMPAPWLRLDHRLAVAASLDADPHLAALAGALVAGLRRRVQREPLPLAPAWRRA